MISSTTVSFLRRNMTIYGIQTEEYRPDEVSARLKKGMGADKAYFLQETERLIPSGELLSILLVYANDIFFCPVKAEEAHLNVDLLTDEDKVCAKVRKHVLEYFRSRPEFDVESCIRSTLRIMFYTGAGAAAKWKENWKELQEKGIFETLAEPRGAFEMDEYISDLIGYPWGTKEAQDFSNTIFVFVNILMSILATRKDKTVRNFQYLEICLAMYYFGTVFEMDRL